MYVVMQHAQVLAKNVTAEELAYEDTSMEDLFAAANGRTLDKWLHCTAFALVGDEEGEGLLEEGGLEDLEDSGALNFSQFAYTGRSHLNAGKKPSLTGVYDGGEEDALAEALEGEDCGEDAGDSEDWTRRRAAATFLATGSYDDFLEAYNEHVDWDDKVISDSADDCEIQVERELKKIDMPSFMGVYVQYQVGRIADDVLVKAEDSVREDGLNIDLDRFLKSYWEDEYWQDDETWCFNGGEYVQTIGYAAMPKKRGRKKA